MTYQAKENARIRHELACRRMNRYFKPRAPMPVIKSNALMYWLAAHLLLLTVIRVFM